MTLIEMDEFISLAQNGYQVVDARKPQDFCDGFFKGAISISFDENFVLAFQELIESELKVLIIAQEDEITEIFKAIKAASIHNVHGFLKGGFDPSKTTGKTFDLLIAIDAEEFAIDYRFDEFFLVD